jgi:hypothetical protein
MILKVFSKKKSVPSESLWVGRVVEIQKVFQRRNVSRVLDRPDWKKIECTGAWVWLGVTDSAGLEISLADQFMHIDCTNLHPDLVGYKLIPEVTPPNSDNAIMYLNWMTYKNMHATDKREFHKALDTLKAANRQTQKKIDEAEERKRQGYSSLRGK